MSEKNHGTMTASEQIDMLASFIMHEVEGEPSRSEGAIPCAIRIIQQLKAENETLKGKVFDMCKDLLDTDEEAQATIDALLTSEEDK